ncbi:MAG: HU family DNA-binding protein [Clostridia bacterium]|nr:HU family DNA-binding protein [Clostridia bacterium]
MNKSEFIKAWAESCNMSQKDLSVAFDSAYEILVKALKEGEEVKFPGFLTFGVKVKKGGVMLNPFTKQEVEVADKKVPVVKFGKNFKDAFNEEATEEVSE